MAHQALSVEILLPTDGLSPGNVPVSHPPSTRSRLALPFLRAAILALSIAALLLMLLNKQSASIDAADFLVTLPHGVVFQTRTAQFKLITALSFYLAAMAVASAYTLLQLVINVVALITGSSIQSGLKVSWAVFILDQAIAYVFVSATAVAIEIAYLAERGAKDLMWNPICKYFNHFCHEYAAGVALSLLAMLLSFLVAAISACRLFRHGHSQHNAPHKFEV